MGESILGERRWPRLGRKQLLPQGRTDHEVSNLQSDWPQVMDEQWWFGGA